jgi:proteasome beta subunit
MEGIGGATTVGLVCRDGVILASEKKMTYGYTVVSRTARKIFQVTKNIGIACAGLVSDMQAIARILSANAELLSLELKRPVSVLNVAKLLSSLMFGRRLMPYFTEVIVAGLTESTPKLYVLDPLGSLLEEKYAALGSGGAIAIGVIESKYRDDISVENGEKLVLEAIRAAIMRDAASGEGIDLMIITKEGISEKTLLI